MNHPSVPALLQRQRELDDMAAQLNRDRAALVETGGASGVEVAFLKRAEGDARDAANCCKSLVTALRRRDAEPAMQAVG